MPAAPVWPPPVSARPDPAPARRGPGGLVVATIVVLAVLVVALGVALVRPDLFGLSAASPFAAGDDLRATVLATPSASEA